MRASPERVVITPGGKPVMFFAMLALCEPGDELVYPDPGFPMYASIADFAGATPVPLPLREENGFRVDPEELAGLVTDRTKLLILNSPQNPCGSVLTTELVEAVARSRSSATSWCSPTRSTRPCPTAVGVPAFSTSTAWPSGPFCWTVGPRRSP